MDNVVQHRPQQQPNFVGFCESEDQKPSREKKRSGGKERLMKLRLRDARERERGRESKRDS